MKTRIVFILDRSGSMEAVRKDTIGGFNSFLKVQKKLEGDVSFTLAQFDDKYELVYDDVDINKVKKLNDETFVPRGMTALLDAIGKTIKGIRKKKNEMIIVAILTDGHENSSKEYSNAQIKKLIEKCRKKNWGITFLAANEDAFETALSYGISTNNTIAFANTSEGHIGVWDTMGSAYSKIRMRGEDGSMDDIFNK